MGGNPHNRNEYISFALISLMLIILVGSSKVFFLFSAKDATYTHQQAQTQGNSPIGHAFFMSSGLLNPNSSQGIADGVQINLHAIDPPQSGKNYYAWLLSEKAVQYSTLYLGTLQVNNNTAQLTYQDSQHLDLLAHNSRLLITQEDAGNIPSNPSLDQSTWTGYAAFSETPNPLDTTHHYSLYDHLRHLLAEDPKLKNAGLVGGLNIWLFRNTEKLLEWAGSARDAWSTPDGQAFMLRQVTRILDYLDGASYVSMDIPQGMTTLLTDPEISRIGLLTSDLHQEPPAYLKHIGLHLGEISRLPDTTDDQHRLAIQINRDLNYVKGWLEAVHEDAKKLIRMDSTQLSQPETLHILDDMFTQANYAFVGQTDTATNQTLPGVVQINYDVQRMATFDIRPCTSSNLCS